MPSLLTRRTRGRTNEITAAAAFNLGRREDMERLNSLMVTTRATIGRAWEWYDAIPEVNYAIDRGADLAGHATIGVYQRNADGTRGDPVVGDIASYVSNNLYSPYGGQRRLVSSFFALERIAGEMHLIKVRGSDSNGRDVQDGFDFVSSSELTVTDGKLYRVTAPGATGSSDFTIELAMSDYIGRVWNPHWRHVEMVRSPLRSLDVICEELHLLTLGLKSKLLNRIALSGLLFIPAEMAEVIPANLQSGQIKLGTFSNDLVINTLISSMTVAVTNHDQPTAALPIIIRGPGIHGEQIRWITMDREILATEMNLREEAVKRVLTGLDVQPETVTGMGDSNHWNAWSIMEQDVKINVEPDLETMVWALNRLWFWPALQAGNEIQGDPEKLMLWYDLSKASVPTNLGENARQASDRIAVSNAALRRASGFTEADAPDEDEQVRIAGRIARDPYMMTWGLSVQDELDWTRIGAKGSQPGPTPNSGGDPSPVGPGVGEPGSPGGGDTNTPASQTPQ